MDFELWLGTEASHEVVRQYTEQFSGANGGVLDKAAFLPSPFDREDTVQKDAVFGVDEDRIGLTIMQKVGDYTVIDVRGSLVPNFSRWHVWLPGYSTSYQAIRDALAIAGETGQKKVLMNFDSQGGSVRGLSSTTQSMKRYEGTGGVIHAHTDSLAASAAYWLMAGAKQVTATDMAELGSIGTMAVIRTMVNTEQTQGQKYTVLKAGKYKAAGNPFEELTKEMQDYLQKNIDDTNQFFLNHVSVNRNLMLSEVGVWAEGQVFFAQKAKQVGLIDKVTTLDDLLAASGPAAHNPSETRRFEMEISAEKLAQIQAGADPKDVLTEAELKMYNEAIAKNADATGGEGDGGKPAVTEEESDKPNKEAVTQPTTGTFSEELKKALQDNGRLEGKVEALGGEIESLKQANEALTKQMASLLVVAQDSVTKMQVALGKPRQAQATVPEVLAQFTELQGEMAKVFKTSRQSNEDPTKDSTTAGPGGNFRLQHMNQ